MLFSRDVALVFSGLFFCLYTRRRYFYNSVAVSVVAIVVESGRVERVIKVRSSVMIYCGLLE